MVPARSSHLPLDVHAATGRLRGTDWFWIALAVSIPVAGWMMQVVGTDQVALLGNSQHPLPQLCGARAWLGIDCPACGITRSIIYLVHGQWADSWQAHRLGWLVLLVIVGQVPYRLWVPWQRRISQPRWSRYEAALWTSLGILFILNRVWTALV